MAKYIDTEKLTKAIEEKGLDCSFDLKMERLDTLALIDELQQEQADTDMKSPFTGGKVTILSREEEVTFRGEIIKITRKYYRCVDTGREFTDSKLDDDMMWAVFRTYCEKKGMTSFADIMLKQEQPSLPSNLDEVAFKYENELWESGYKNCGYSPQEVNDAFKAGAEWREAQIPKLPDNVDEAADTFAHNGDVNGVDGEDYEDDLRITFKAGAEWMAGQGYTTKETVYFERLCDETRIMVDFGPTGERGGFQPGDKVIVQIRKK